MNRTSLLGIISVLAILSFSSCNTTKQFLYLQDMNTNLPYPATDSTEAVIETGDRLNIEVTCKNQELALPFNHKGAYLTSVNGDYNSNIQKETDESVGYLVNDEGNITFPILGRVHVAGLTTTGVSDQIKRMIEKGNYISNPIVTTDILNFKVYMLGAVNHTGPINVKDGQITILQALSQAGDLSKNAKTDKVKVVRKVNEQRMVYELNIKGRDIFNSPAYNLKQNDIVYVEPKYVNRDAYENGFRYGSIITSLASLVLTLIYIFK